MAAADTRTVTIQLSRLTEHLSCSLCGGMLREAQTIPECLHSFCKSCIYRHFLVENGRACPKCLIPLNRPMASLISDQRLQDVVDRIFPEYRENDARCEEEFYAKHGFKKKKLENGTAQVSNGHRASSNSTSVPRARKKSTSPLPETGGPRRMTPYVIEVRPGKKSDRTLPALKKPYLSVDGRFKIFDLLKWLRHQLELKSTAELEVTCLDTIVGPELSVQFVYRTLWQLQEKRRAKGDRVVLEYRLLIP